MQTAKFGCCIRSELIHLLNAITASLWHGIYLLLQSNKIPNESSDINFTTLSLIFKGEDRDTPTTQQKIFFATMHENS